MSSIYTVGFGSLQELPSILALHGSKKIFLVTGKKSYAESGAADEVSHVLEKGSALRFCDFDPNPKLEDAQRGAVLAKEFGADLIIAIGGGSVIDMAKLIKAFLTNPDSAEALAKGTDSMTAPGLPFVAIPTTAGTGSEATHFAVVYLGGEKYSLASPFLLPDNIVLDGQLVSSSTPYQKACSGLDAMAQAIESAWAVNSTVESRSYAIEALKGLIAHLPTLVKGSGDEAVCQSMIVAANLAGRAINISKTTAAHAWSYGITSQYGVPHGHAVWLTLPEIMEMHAESVATGNGVSDPRGVVHLEKIMAKLCSVFGISRIDELSNTLQSFMKSIGAEPMMENLGADCKSRRFSLSEQVNMERMSNNPIHFSGAQIEKIFRI